MKNLAMWLRVLVAVIGMTCVMAPTALRAADDDDDRDRQTQIQRPMLGRAVCPPGMCVGALPPRAPRCPYACRLLTGFAIWLAIIHVILAVWVYTDILKRGEGHGVFVVLALMAGIPATILYALVRIGDAKKA
jgi:hypothetical protein